MKTFTAATMPQALAMVKHELGSNAVILHTRSYQRGGFLGFGAKPVVEITASDDPQVGLRRPVETRPPRRPPAAPARPSAEQEQAAGNLIRRTYAAAQSEFNKKPKPPSIEAQPPGCGTSASVPTAGGEEQLVEEMRSVKRMVGQMVRQQRHKRHTNSSDGVAPAGKPDMPDKLFDQYLALLEQEVAEELAEEVIDQVCDILGPSELEDEAAVRQAALNVIAKQIPTDEMAGRLAPVTDGRPRTIALVGPTGVGKTTTIAKLAATFKLKQKKKVALITLDTYRIAAVDQLRTYANIIGVPLHVVTCPDELIEALARCKGCDTVLIDTAGRSQRDDPRLEQLRTLIAVADPHEVHLVLSSTCSQPVLLEVVERFSQVRADRIIFTKLDEAVSFGVLLNVARKVNKRLSYITTGQEVPHQIEPSTPARLAALLLGEGQPC